ncbi:hypothetical protein ACFYOV_17600 [Streptomyces sp. NPDC005931]|uniref:hypothetical protein n=1 Tax=Streptomyces sp. NPDC005931 TaxID=3364737 RepID=UPI00368074CE
MTTASAPQRPTARAATSSRFAVIRTGATIRTIGRATSTHSRSKAPHSQVFLVPVKPTRAPGT